MTEKNKRKSSPKKRKNSPKKRKNTAKNGKKKKSEGRSEKYIVAGIAAVLVVICGFLMVSIFGGGDPDTAYQWPSDGVSAGELNIDVQLLTVNPYSRPGVELSKINGIVVHYTANPGATAQENRDYFEGLKDSHETKASSNFIVGLNGEVIQCVPTWEEAYASNDRNMDTISIECCHPDESGKFTDETYWSLVELCAFLCEKYNLNQDDIIRHYDVTGKICPKYFVDNESAWETFRGHVKKALKEQ